MTEKKKKSVVWPRILSFALMLALMVYVGYQIYRGVFAETTTEMAVMHSVYESFETQGLVFRSETAVPPVTGGYAYYAIENGTRVSKDSVIASVYGDSQSGHIEQQIRDIEEQIAALREIQADGSTGRITLDIINKQVNDTLFDFVAGTNGGMFEDMEGYHFALLSLLSKKQLVTGKEVDFSGKISQLEQQKTALSKELKQATSVIRAPVAGYFADHTDGYEEMLDVNGLADLSVAKLQNFMSAKPAVSTQTGKIVSGYEWYIACVVPDSYYNMLGEGKNLTLRMSFVSDDPVPVTVYACNKDGDGKLAVVFRCDYMSEELATIRKETVEIQMVEHTGIKVPKRAIVVDENQQTGVYVRSGNVVSFRKIEQTYSEAADYVICEVVNEDGYLELYDDIIVGGRGLYDGKIIS